MAWEAWKWALSGVGVVGVFAFVRRVFASGRPSAPSCSTEFTAFNHGPPRDMRKVGLIVLHATDPPKSPEPTARSTANWFAQKIPLPKGPYSAHVVVGPDGCYRTLGDSLEAWGAGDPANLHGLHIEQAGHSTWSRAQWLDHEGTIRAAAGQAAAWSAQYDIPLRFLYAADLHALDAAGWPKGHGGVTTHAELSKAFPHATNHGDPGPGYPLDVFFELAGGTYDAEGA
jgi:hypothetical protein